MRVDEDILGSSRLLLVPVVEVRAVGSNKEEGVDDEEEEEVDEEEEEEGTAAEVGKNAGADANGAFLLLLPTPPVVEAPGAGGAFFDLKIQLGVGSRG